MTIIEHLKIVTEMCLRHRHNRRLSVNFVDTLMDKEYFTFHSCYSLFLLKAVSLVNVKQYISTVPLAAYSIQDFSADLIKKDFDS